MERPVVTRILVLVLAVVAVGLLGGLTGAFLANSTLEDYARSLQEQIVVREVTAPKPPSVPASAHEAIAVVKERTQMNSVPVVNVRDRVHVEGIVASQGIATATALTTDGWFMLPKTASSVDRHQLVVEGEAIELVDVVADPLTEIAFVKTDVSEARVGTFGNSTLVASGDLVYVVDRDRVVPRTILESWHVEGERGVQSSDELERTFLLDQPIDALPGSLVTDGSGAVLGVMVSSVEVRPLHQLTASFESVLLEAEVIRPALGLTFTDTTRVVVEGVREGLLVQSVPRALLDLDEPLAVGDIILRVDGVSVHDRPLSEIVTAGKEGDELILAIERPGEEEVLEISVTL